MNAMEKQYPADVAAEYSLIGCILCDNSLMASLSFLKIEDFYSREYAAVFAAMLELYRDSQPITAFTIKPKLPHGLMFGDDGAVKHIAASISASLLVGSPVELAKSLVQLSRRREMAIACDAVSLMVCSGNKPVEEYAAEMQNAIERISRDNPLEEFKTDADIAADILQSLRDDRRPTSTGLPRLDMAMDGGMYPGKSYGFAAKKKMGKTMLASTISGNLARQGIRHLFICCEMSPAEIHQRTLSRELDCYPSAFRSEYGKSPEFQKRLAKAVVQSGKHILYRNAPGLTFDELRRLCRNAVERHAVKGIILDYWQLVGGKENRKSTSEHLDEVAQWISDFGRKNGVWMFVLAQINQEGNTRGGEGIRLAFDQVYALKAPGDDPSRSGRYIEMMDTRYTAWANIGTDTCPAYHLNEKGLYFEEEIA